MKRISRYDPRASAQRSPTVNVLIGAAVLAALLVFVFVGLRAPTAIPGRKYYTVSAHLKDAGNLAPHADVRIGGARVGQVLELRTVDGRPALDLQLETSVRPLLSDAVVRVRPKSAIGQPYIDLDPGRRGSAIADHGWIAASRTANAIPLDRVLSSFDLPTRTRFRQLMTELGQATVGRGEGGGRTIDAAPGMLRDVQIATKALASEPQAIRGFVDHSADLADSFANVKTEFAAMFGPASRVLAAMASERPALADTLRTAPATFAAVDDGLGRVNPALDHLDALAGSIQAPLRKAPAALRETSRMLRTAQRTVPRIDATLVLAKRAVSPTLRLLRTTQSASPWLDGLVNGADPTVKELAPRRCDIVRLTRNWQNMFAFGEPKQGGGTGLDLDIATPGLNAIGGLPPIPGDVPILRNAYPGPCQSYDNGRDLAGHQGG